MKKIIFIVAALSVSVITKAQVGLNTTNPDPSAALDVSSTTKGLLIPRMTAANITAISNPATGLMVFQTDGARGLYINNGIPAAPSWQQMATTGTTSPSNVVESYSDITNATTASVVSVGGIDFRFNSAGYVEARTNNYIHVQVYSKYISYSFAPASGSESAVVNDQGYYSTWSPLIESYNYNTSSNENILMAGYSTHDCDIHALDLPAGPPVSYIVHAATDGYNNVFLRVAYYH